ncbi:hypothetical protein VCHA50P416_30430 [Vibrio chagasii]|nr:hypothetical protein VCHA38P215_10006 [Vibrio chagasii]CAH7049911.1 hypothetical protein VCHA48P434_10009 [Vibrio chagasii]CAH7228167.1 hypothetical protein VCHA42P256_30431 [Vibrio chagasii]CAH7264099.1 hypothetical protein VCHA43P272_30430 [Vibrio chagasii]CAH7437900.1 hypothetical protein VCHA50P416_30430 [Vibrio chagasii]
MQVFDTNNNQLMMLKAFELKKPQTFRWGFQSHTKLRFTVFRIT